MPDIDPASWGIEDDFMNQHEPLDPTHIGDDFDDLEQRRFDALCELLFEGADHLESDCHSGPHSPSNERHGPEPPWQRTLTTSTGSRVSFQKPLADTLIAHKSKVTSPQSGTAMLERDSQTLTRPVAKRNLVAQHANHRRSSIRQRASLATLFSGLLLASFCFFKGASAPIEQTRAIEDIRPGYRVMVDAPEEAIATDVARLNDLDASWNASTGSLEVDGIADPLRALTDATPAQLQKADYRLVLLQAKELWEDSTYNEINVSTLQPWQWIHEHEVHVGGQAPLPLETVEMNLPFGMTGKVLDILPCPPIERGRGRVVLTTVNRLARGVIELTLRDANGREDTLRPTDEHLFYSASRGNWLSAGELQVGEHLDGVNGRITVAAITPLEGTHRVYNMTVQGEHLYRVGGCGVLVHNTCAGFHHFIMRALGSKVPYKDSVLRHLNSFRHTKLHRQLSEHLESIVKTVDGKTYTMLPKKGQKGEVVRDIFTQSERLTALDNFYRTYNGGEYYKDFLKEMAETLSRGLFK
ncbi:MAG: hypothetical protein H6822_03895 [Planctomycetaceae bacterium]|nr:hypothetical protein [Planctomycetales bacterium]MCB9921299.1 hypothetical protein [Planctomycetaceae bacterium]